MSGSRLQQGQLRRRISGQASENQRRISEASLLAEQSTRSSLSSGSSNEDSNVKVAVRCRPMSEKESADGHQSIIEFEGNRRVVVHNVNEAPSDQLGTQSGERKNFSHVYDFDHVFRPDSSQEEVFESVCKPIVDSVLQGYNGTIFAYGQTGTGKTHTMEGVNGNKSTKRRASTNAENTIKYKSESRTASSANSPQVGRTTAAEPIKADRKQSRENSAIKSSGHDKSEAGIIPRTFQQIFNHVAKNTSIQFLIRASYLEIYQEEIRDLLIKDNSTKLELHERPDVGVYVKDLTSFVCKSIAEIERVMRVGNQNRTVGATDMNEHSSRSHAIFMITVEQQQQQSKLDPSVLDCGPNEGAGTTSNNKQKRTIKVGKLNLVDLAGSERQRKTNSFGQRQQESIKINLSLSALGNVINSLMKIHVHEQKLQQKQQQQQSISSPTERPGSNKQHNTLSAGSQQHTPYRDSKLTRLLQDSLGGNSKTLMIANIGPASYNYDETINTLNYASRARCIKNKPRLNEDPKDALLRELQQEIDLLRMKLASVSTAGASNCDNNKKLIDDHSSSKHVGSTIKEEKKIIPNEKQNVLVEKEFVELRQKLSSLERKLLNSDVSLSNNSTINSGSSALLLDSNLLKGYTRKQEVALELQRSKLIDQHDRQKSIQNELERREEVELLAKKTFDSLQQEIESKRKLIRQILLKTKSVRDEIDSTQQAYRLELDELDQLQLVLQKELKLKCLIMDNFIPNGHVDQLLPRVIYDERRNLCSIQPIDLAVKHCNYYTDSSNFMDFWRPTYNSIRPKSEFERISEAIYPNDIRYKYENLIEPKLEELPPKSHTNHVLGIEIKAADELVDDDVDENVHGDKGEGGAMIQKLIDEALNQREPDIVI